MTQALPMEFIIFGLTLLGVAIFRHFTLSIALTGFVAIAGYRVAGQGLSGLAGHFSHEWVLLADLLGLLLGFAILARHFEKSHVPLLLPRYLPADWRGGFLLLMLVFLLSGLLDNIAGALIGGSVAHQVFRGRVHVSYLVGIVAAANAGGAGSVVGDTTTTMIWIAGASPLLLLKAYPAGFVAAAICALIAARRQHAHSPIFRDIQHHQIPDLPRLAIVVAMLAAAIATNITVNLEFPHLAHAFPFVGSALWLAILITMPVRRHDWEVLPSAGKQAVFLLSLVASASMMPVNELPPASWQTALGLGFVSSFFDNIPLTALAIRQGGYDWAVLAYAVGFGGTMLWFGSTAGVALCGTYHEARSMKNWLRHGWYVPLAYIAGFLVVLLLFGWHPTTMR